MGTGLTALCPSCRAALRIPAEWVGKSVKCKKCGAVVNVKPKAAPKPPAAPAPAVAPWAAARPVAPPRPQAAPVPMARPVSPPPAPVPAAYPYSPPTGHEPTPADLFAVEVESPITRQYRNPRRRNPLVTLVSLVAGVAALGGIGYAVWPFVAERWNATNKPADGTQAQLGGKDTEKPNPAASADPFPRRMLFVSVSKYFFCNPLSAGPSAGSQDFPTRAAESLAAAWKVPTARDDRQLFVLSDTASGSDYRPLFGSVLRPAFEQFFATSRPQDRIVVYFGGHAVERGGKAYLVPQDGDLENPDTLLPLDDFYGKLKDCKAQQKVVIFDVCRMPPDGAVRPGSEPLTAALAEKLLAPPDGVQVCVTCSPGQNAREDDSSGGSQFLRGVHVSARLGKLAPAVGKAPLPDDPVPLAQLATQAGAWLADRAKAAKAEGKPWEQTPQVAGAEPAAAVAYNPDEPLAKRFDPPPPPRTADPKEVEGIVNLLSLPPVRRGLGTKAIPVDLIPFRTEVMSKYKADGPTPEGEADPVRKATVDALGKIRDVWAQAGGEDGTGFRERFDGQASEAVKKRIREEQANPAKAIVLLEEVLQSLEDVGEQAKEEKSKRWVATYQYALAQAKLRLAFLHEYNLALGDILTESLPENKAQSGFQLVTVEKLKSGKDVLRQAREAKELFAKITEEHKRTPWEILAREAKGITLGLRWEPVGGKDEKEPPAEKK